MTTEYQGVEIRPIPGLPNYWVSEDGRIYTQPRPRVRGGWMRLSIHRGGYPYTSGRVNGRQVCIYAHRAVALAWIGPPPSEGMQVCHNDSDPRNTHVKNLRWDTPYGNTQDTVRAGRMNGGRPHGS